MIPCTDSSHIIDCNKSDSTQSTPTLSANTTASTAPINVSTLVDDCGRPCGLEHSLINANVTPLNEDNQVSINHIQLCTDSRKLMLAGKYFATMISFTKRDVISDVPVRKFSKVISVFRLTNFLRTFALVKYEWQNF